MNSSYSFGDWLRQRRKALDLTQDELAGQVGCAIITLRKLETEERKPSKQLAERLAEVLRVPAAEWPAFQNFARGDPFAAPPNAAVVFAPAPTPSTRHNLPLQLTSFIGREHEIVEISRLLASARLVTLTGAGGSGKTRLAEQTAAGLLDHYPDGVWLVELAPLADPALLAQTVALGVSATVIPGVDPADALRDFLRPKQLLLVLDNCEHLVQACAELSQSLLSACARLTILATSRETLRIGGETAYVVPLLSAPDGSFSGLPADLSGFEAVRLFVERAVSALPGFKLTSANAPAVAQVCQQLDGIPLAIELAAARVSVLTPEQIAARLDDRLHLLTSGSRSALPRQQTLRALIDWGYELLPEPERRLFSRLSVFAGGWTLEAAEAVAAGDGLDTAAILDGLAALVHKSLVVAEPGPGAERRYRLLETIRQYAREKLEAAESDRVRQRHLAYYTALAEATEPALRGRDQVTAFNRLELEIHNLRAALAWSLEHGPGLGLRLAGALAQFWVVRTRHWREGQDWLAKGLAWPGARDHPLAQAKGLNGAAYLARDLGDGPQAIALYEQALPLWRAAGNARGEADALRLLGATLVDQGEPDRGRPFLEQSLALSRAVGDGEGVAWTLYDLGVLAENQGDRAAARAFWEESLALHRGLNHAVGVGIVAANAGRLAGWWGDAQAAEALGQEALAAARATDDQRVTSMALDLLSAVADHQGDLERALALANEALAIAREWGLAVNESRMIYRQGGLALKQGDLVTAEARFRENLTLCLQQGVRDHWPTILTAFAAVYDAQGQLERAARLSGAAGPLYAAFHVSTHSFGRLDHETVTQHIRARLEAERFAALQAEGQALTLEQAIELALASE